MLVKQEMYSAVIIKCYLMKPLVFKATGNQSVEVIISFNSFGLLFIFAPYSADK